MATGQAGRSPGDADRRQSEAVIAKTAGCVWPRGGRPCPGDVRRTYLTVCAKLGVTPASTAHVGDLYDLDVTAPCAAGLHAVYFDRQSAGPLEEPHRITSLRQLPHELHRERS